MTPDDPRHGTYAGSIAHYKNRDPLCDPCKVAHRTYNRRSQKQRRRGDIRHVDAALVVRRIARLRAAGMTLPSIAEASGVTRGTVENIAFGRRQTVRVATACAIAALSPREAQPDRVEAWRVTRRLQALSYCGWTAQAIAERSGWSRQNVAALITDRWRHRETVSTETFETFDRVYRELSMLIPPDTAGAKVARSRAARNGYAPPMAWDDIDTDDAPAGIRKDWGADYDSNELVDENTVLRILSGEVLRTNRAEKAEVMRRWLAAGQSERSLCVRMGWKDGRYVSREGDAA